MFIIIEQSAFSVDKSSFTSRRTVESTNSRLLLSSTTLLYTTTFYHKIVCVCLCVRESCDCRLRFVWDLFNMKREREKVCVKKNLDEMAVVPRRGGILYVQFIQVLTLHK